MELINIKQTVMDFFEGNPILNIVTLVLAIGGIIFTIYFYFKSKKIKLPTYAVRTINLVREKIQKIETVQILFSGEKIDNLSISKIALWNEGKETINCADVAKNNPLKATIKEEFEILECEILYQKNTANDFKAIVSEDNKSVDINFDYFDFEEGVVLQIYHTGNTSDDIKLTGTFKSVNRIKRKEILNTILPEILVKNLRRNTHKSNRKINRYVMGWGIILAGIFIITIFPFMSHETKQIVESPSFFSKIAGSLVGIPYIWLGYRMLKRFIPKGFDIFNEEF
jgi:hypothetical protein